jgi:MSHA biogenesis protein MshK
MSATAKLGLLFAGMLSAAAMPAGAQGLADPTRPPAGLVASDAYGEANGGPVLQSVMISPGRKAALISGQVVVLGGKYGSARLVRLTESEAVLRDGSETTVLRLYPLVDKRPAGKPQSGEAKAGTVRTTK